MKLSATELKQRTGQALDEAQRGPVKVVKHGRVYGAIISKQDLEILEEAKKTQSLHKAVQAGFDQIDHGKFSTRTMSELADEARRKVGKPVQ